MRRALVRRFPYGVYDEVKEATQAYREEMNVFGAFLADRCVVEAGAEIGSKEIRDAYNAWAQENGENEATAKKLANALRDRGFEPTKGTKGARGWKRLRLRRDGEEPTPGGGRQTGGGSSD